MARPPLIALSDVRLADGPSALFEGVDLALEPGARACLVGRNGTGKSTLLRLIAGRIEADSGERFLQPGASLSLVAQEPAIVGARIIDHVTQGGVPLHEGEAALALFGLDGAKSTAGLSGGEARRAELARALAEKPDILLLDEPTNHLDILAIEALEKRLAGSRTALLIVSHDRAFLTRVTNRCFWLEQKRVRRLDEGFSAFDDWAAKIADQEAEETRKLGRELAREEHWLSRGVTARRARNEGRLRRLKALRETRRERLAQAGGGMALASESAGLSGRKVLEATNIAKTLGGRTLFSNLSTRILRGDRIALAGPNGAGKTTLLKVLLGELQPDQGEVKVGTNLAIAYIDQTRARLKETDTLWETLAPAGGDQILVRGAPKHVAAYAKEFQFWDSQLRQPVSTLSGGERNRLLLALALARPSNLMVLDEPTNDLDMETLDLLEDMIEAYDGTVILVSHDRDFIDRLAASTIVLDGRGRLVETPGGWSDFLRQNPGFFERGTTPKDPAPAKVAAPAAPTKLSYKDERRLAELDRLMPALADKIAALERALADPGLYGRDPAAFARTSGDLEKTRHDLNAAETEWLDLETRRPAKS